MALTLSGYKAVKNHCTYHGESVFYFKSVRWEYVTYKLCCFRPRPVMIISDELFVGTFYYQSRVELPNCQFLVIQTSGRIAVYYIYRYTERCLFNCSLRPVQYFV